jgi:hypothetical protein
MALRLALSQSLRDLSIGARLGGRGLSCDLWLVRNVAIKLLLPDRREQFPIVWRGSSARPEPSPRWIIRTSQLFGVEDQDGAAYLMMELVGGPGYARQ